jgi:DNA-binding transcriptional ArsR family regulator
VGRGFIFNPEVDDRLPKPDSPHMPDPLDQVFAALADPTRRAILAMLLEDDMAVTDVAHPFAISLAAISKHLAVLADAGLISRERRGRVIWCKLEPDGMRAASVWMQGFGQFEALDLDAFERFLAEELREEASLPEEETVSR